VNVGAFHIATLVSAGFLVLSSLSCGTDAGEKETAKSLGRNDPSLATADAIQKRSRSLVAELDSDKFAVREMAMRELTKIGPPAIESLEGALKSRHFETRRRAQAILINLDQRRRSVSIPSVLGDAIVPLEGAFTSLQIGHVTENSQVVSDQLDAEDVIIDLVDGRGQLTLAGKARRLQVGTIAGEAKIDVSSLRVDELAIGSMNDSAEIKVKSLDSVQFPTGIGIGFRRSASGVTLSRLPVVREESPTVTLYETLESVWARIQHLGYRQRKELGE
jgi:hypothetical protein